MPQVEIESGSFPWDDQAWVNLSNEISNNSEGDKEIPIQEMGEGRGKKRSRGAPRKEKEKVDNVEKKEEGEASDHELHIWTERERRKKMRNMFSNLQSLVPQLPSKADKTTIVDQAVSYIKQLQSTLQRLQKMKLERRKAGPMITNSVIDEPSVAATSKLAMLSTRETFMADQVSSLTKNNHNNIKNKNNSLASTKASPSTTTFSASASRLPVVIETWTSDNVVLNICGNDAHFAVYAPKKPGLFTTLCCVLEKNRMEIVSSHISCDDDRCIYFMQVRMAKGASDEFPELMTVEEMYKHAAGEMTIYV